MTLSPFFHFGSFENDCLNAGVDVNVLAAARDEVEVGRMTEFMAVARTIGCL